MTSKSLFFKLMKEDLKRRIWTIALSMLVFLVILTINCSLRFGMENRNWEDGKYLINQLLNLVGIQSGLLVFFTIVGAIVCGLSGFFYLLSKKKVDLFHSIPVRRETLFAVSYMNGILIYLIPYIINLLFCLLIIQFNQYMSQEILFSAISALGLNLLYFLFIYTVTIIAVMLTGNLVISCLGSAVFFLYYLVVNGLQEAYFNEFFITYYTKKNTASNLFHILNPMGNYIETVERITEYSTSTIAQRIIAVLLFTLLLLGLALFFYRKRPSEAAGKAMAFSLSKPIIKFFLIIPASLTGGLLFRSVTNRNSMGWFIFGLIFIYIIAYAIIEIIYNFDVRCAFRNRKHMLAFAGVVGIIVCIFQFDLLRYNTYIPKESSVESMSVSISGLDSNLSYNGDDYIRRWYIDQNSYHLNNMILKDFDAAYELAKVGLKYNMKLEDYSKESFYYYVKYKLKSGREVYRKYLIPWKASYEYVEEIYRNPDFKETHFPIYKWGTKEMESIICRDMLGTQELLIESKEKYQLIDLYKEEVKTLTLGEISSSYPVARINSNNYSNVYYIYPSFTKTVAFLNELGFDLTKLDLSNITKIEVENIYNGKEFQYDNSISKDEARVFFVDAPERPFLNVYFTKLNEYQEIVPLIINREYYFNNTNLIQVEDSVIVNVYYHNGMYEREDIQSFYFPKDKIPEFVKKAIRYNKEQK